MLGGVVVERGQRLPIPIELRQRLGVLRAVLLPEHLERPAGVPAGRRLDDLVQQPLRPGLQPLREAVEHVARGVEPAALLAGAWEHIPQRGPRSESTVADDELRFVQAAALEIAEHARPALGRLAVPVLDREQLLAPVLTDADHDQQTHLWVLTEPDLDVDPVHEQIGVAVEAQQPLTESSVVSLPLLAQPADRRGRQAGGVLTEEPLQRRAEVPGREATEVQDRDHLPDLRRPARVRRQDPRAEPLPPALLIDALVVHARRADRDRPGPDRHLPLTRATVADHQPAPILVGLVAEPLDVLVGLSPKRGGDHPPRALPRQVIQRERDLLVALPDGEPANI